MAADKAAPVLVAGAGIAGLTAALAFASRGFPVRVFERAASLDEVGAGLQLSPNATRILDRLGVLERLMPLAVRTEAVVLRRATSLAQIARVPLGAAGERRWGAPYLVAHRADLQAALLAAVSATPNIELTTGAELRDFSLENGVAAEFADGSEARGRLLVAADGVWSVVRGLSGRRGRSLFIGMVAWRATIAAADAPAGLFAADEVGVFLHPGFHLVAYPVRAGAAINLVAFTKGREMDEGWSGKADTAPLRRALAGAAPALAELAGRDVWSAWPIHIANLDGAWMSPQGLALIGDAAHAMTPFAAQGAAMAIEDADTLAAAIASGADFATALPAWDAARRARIRKVARRGAFNQFAWHARGPVAAARDLVLRLRGPERLAADMDWLYGWWPTQP